MKRIRPLSLARLGTFKGRKPAPLDRLVGFHVRNMGKLSRTLPSTFTIGA